MVLSLAGRTESPAAQGVPTRSGGFGGARGLARHVTEHAFDLLIDATHPYAARISANAAEAARLAGVPILALRRPCWEQAPGDRWTLVDDVAGAVQALGTAPRNVFLSLGRQEVGAFAAAPQHHYLIRSVDPVEPPLAVPHAQYILARGPFREDDERALLTEHHIDAVVSKDSGGAATYGKIVAYPADLNVGALPPAKLALPVEVARYFVWGKFGQHATPARVTLWKHGMGRFGQSA